MKRRAACLIKTGLSILLAVALFMTNSFSQEQKQQRNFGSEIDVEHPINVPRSFVGQLNSEDKGILRDCQRQTYNRALKKDKLSDHFIGSQIQNEKSVGGLDVLVVQANSGCFLGAHNTGFWVLTKRKNQSAEKYKKVFETRGDGLAISTTTHKGYPELELISHTAIELFTMTYRYSREKYRERSCYVENMGDDPANRPRVRCSKYNWEFRK